MKRILLLLTMVIALTAAVNARTFVLITGVSNYGDENTNLTQTTKDAKRFREVMQTQTRDITILTSRYASAENIKEKLRAIANRAQENDRIIFFFSGHGMPNALYTYSGALPYDDLIQILNSSAAKEKICFIDACHAGSMASAVGSTPTSAPQAPMTPTQAIINAAQQYNVEAMNTAGHAFFVSSRPEEYSLESPIVGAGFFTQALVKGLRGAADRDHDRNITVEELFRYMYRDIVRRSDNAQHPQLIAPESMYPVVLATWEETNP